MVETLKDDSIKYRDLKVSKENRRNIMRSLMNIRLPKPISKKFLDIQDQFLKEESIEKGIVNILDIPTIREALHSSHPYNEILSIWQGDITRLKVDAIVNAANSEMLGCFVPCHGCIDNAIHSAAGIELREECFCYMENLRKQKGLNYEEPTGQAMITFGYNLPAKYIIHTVGPIVESELTESIKEELKSCYKSCLNKALEQGIESIAFCCISTGEFHFPNDIAAKIAVDTVTDFLKNYGNNFKRIIFNVFKDIDKDIYEEILSK